MLNIHSRSEEELIEQCKKGNEKARKELYDLYADKMYGVCLRYIREPDTAEDILITAFMKIFDKIDQFQFKGSFEGWIRKIMVNEALSFIRKSKNMYLEVDIDIVEHELDFGQLGSQLEAEDLMKMINRLPTGYKTVFNLYAIEGFSHREIAHKLSIAENTSKSQLSRARVLLQKYLLESEKMLKAKNMRL
ncbi:MAG: RNA polymerase sigma factor [Cyclobacteriaceae bacterium]|nr:RNA polymerase sigma factor [Cyclobacteriaceae bacterium]